MALLPLSFGTPPLIPELQRDLPLPQPLLAPPRRPGPPLINASSVGKPSAVLARVASSALASFLSTPPLISRQHLQTLTPLTVMASFRFSLPSLSRSGTNTSIVQVRSRSLQMFQKVSVLLASRCSCFNSASLPRTVIHHNLHRDTEHNIAYHADHSHTSCGTQSSAYFLQLWLHSPLRYSYSQHPTYLLRS
ncbi:hypothetical protein CY34DRAFT_814155 [Suillus luteus UH-Slu-Lm8-n1]|uniref:Unplaced genomic scaffold CY34scaffold_1033, whole genome shotgun sequence n=1 Tax=Suillus luteus UH-Slu-Lm8-n1 TaxID=930992 RepID=A0A0C9ZTI5_9AGAM|nr:hypothetical protein CY34DRAFT_814155 [Suillus luteus UH-Slu-Lm8-n1]